MEDSLASGGRRRLAISRIVLEKLHLRKFLHENVEINVRKPFYETRILDEQAW